MGILAGAVLDYTAPPRVVCGRCRRPEVVCYCRFVTPLETSTRVVILQHPRERDVPINTARIASLCLPDAELHIGVRWERALGDDGRPAALLYPGPGAIDVEADPPPGPITLVVVDGTWWQARKLVRSNPELARLPRYAFRPKAPSDYRIRREPHEEYVSTIEALVHVLGALEGDRERFLAMLVPFRAMVDAQLAYAASNVAPRRTRTRKKRMPQDPRLRLPAALRDLTRDVVCVYAEANAWPFGTKERAMGQDEIVQLVACRIGTGETLEVMVAPTGSLAPSTTAHLAIDASAILGGVHHEALAAAWSAFVRDTDVVCTWGGYTSELFVRAAGRGLARDGEIVDLRRVARTYESARFGTMEDFARLRGLDVSPPLAAGRAGIRLAQMVPIARGFAGERGR